MKKIKPLNFSITYNDHKLGYETVDEYLNSNYSGFSTANYEQEDIKKAILTDTLWEMIIYPRTPVSNIKFMASSLSKLMDMVNEIYDIDLKYENT